MPPTALRSAAEYLYSLCSFTGKRRGPGREAPVQPSLQDRAVVRQFFLLKKKETSCCLLEDKCVLVMLSKLGLNGFLV